MKLISLRTTFTLATLVSTVIFMSTAGAVVAGQVDDFEDGTPQAWTEGIFSPNKPTNIASGGPAGANDNYLENVSSGAGVEGSKMTMFNKTQWTGDYLAAGITEIRAHVKVETSSASSLSLRVGFQEPTQMGSTGYFSLTPIVVPNDGNWYEITFPIATTDLVPTPFNFQTYNQTMSNVGHFRIFSSTTGKFNGDVISATMGTDNIKAIRPVPLLLRRNDNGRWFRYALNGSMIAATDSVPLTSNLSWDVEAVSDFDGDGEDDVLIRHQDDGRWFLYLMNGAVILDAASMDIATSLDWEVAAVNDFNNDGMTDLLLHNQANGRWRMYLMNGLSVLQTELVDMPSGLVWDTFASGDFDLDGFGDVLLRRSDNGRWRMYRFNADGVTILETALVGLPENAVWVFQSAADFNGDGRLDVLVRRTDNGLWRIYLMDGTMVLDTDLIGFASDANWQVKSTADFNQDGRADALHYNPVTEKWCLYLLNGTTIDIGDLLAISGNPVLELQAVADFDFDGNNDMLMRNVNNGRWFVHTLDGTTVNSSDLIAMTTNLVWSIVAPELH